MPAFVRIPAPRGRSRDVVLGPDLPGWLAVLVQLRDLPFERLVVYELWHAQAQYYVKE